MAENVSYTYMHISHVEELKPSDSYAEFVRRVEAKYNRAPVVVVDIAQGQPQAVLAILPMDAEVATMEQTISAPVPVPPSLQETPVSAPVPAGPDSVGSLTPDTASEKRRPGRPRKT